MSTNNNEVLDALDGGVEALSGESPLQAHEVLAYLQAHPEFFNEHSDSLAQLSLPTQKNGNVISMANWQTHVLRDKVDQSKARLEQLLVQASHNQKNHEKLFNLVSKWLSVRSADELPDMISDDLREQFALDAVQVMVWDERNKIMFYPSLHTWSDNVVVFANSLRTPYCGACKGFEIEETLAKQSPTGKIGSLSIVPLWGKREVNGTARFECLGVLLFGADDAQRFTPDMGTHFLQHIGEMAGSALARLQAPCVTKGSEHLTTHA